MKTQIVAQLEPETLEELGPKVASEARIKITNNISRRSQIFDNMSEEESSRLFSRYMLGRNKSSIFRKPIHHEKNSGEKSDLGKADNKIQQDTLRRPLRDRKWI